MAKKRVLSGVKPSGIPTLGNYIGAISQWKELQDKYDCLFPIVDLHALTPPQDPKELKLHTYIAAATVLGAGIDPKKSPVFLQSQVPAHAELCWLLSSITSMGELSRMTQYKDKVAKLKEKDGIGLGIFTYPVLMAADIFLYSGEVVPVGDDQKQHVELARDLATRFNNRYGNHITVPTPVIRKEGARIMDLVDPSKKMSKSDQTDAGYILVTDDDDTIRRKIMRATTDSKTTIEFDPKRPGLYNLLTVYKFFSGKTEKQIEAKFKDQGYGAFKQDLADLLVIHLSPIRKQIESSLADTAKLDKILAAGAKEANKIAEQKLAEIKSAMGLIVKK